MVSPLIRTPTAMMASKAPEEVESEERSVVDEARRSPAEGPPVEVPWIWEAEKRLENGGASAIGYG
jgi:hypothetical protein